MDHIMMVIWLMERSMALEFKHGMMGLYIMEILIMIKYKDMEAIFQQMEIFTKVSIIIIKNKVKVNYNGQVEKPTKAYG